MGSSLARYLPFISKGHLTLLAGHSQTKRKDWEVTIGRDGELKRDCFRPIGSESSFETASKAWEREACSHIALAGESLNLYSGTPY